MTIIKGVAFEHSGEVRCVVRKGKTTWLGVELEAPLEDGGNNGTAKDGTRYFCCAPGSGVYVRAQEVRHRRAQTHEEMMQELEADLCRVDSGDRWGRTITITVKTEDDCFTARVDPAEAVERSVGWLIRESLPEHEKLHSKHELRAHLEGRGMALEVICGDALEGNLNFQENGVESGATLSAALKPFAMTLHQILEMCSVSDVNEIIPENLPTMPVGAAAGAIWLAPGCYPLHWAATTGNCGAILTLLDAGADVNCKTSAGLTPLYLAQGQLRKLQALQRSSFETSHALCPITNMSKGRDQAEEYSNACAMLLDAGGVAEPSLPPQRGGGRDAQ